MKIILHIGTEATGALALQTALHDKREQLAANARLTAQTEKWAVLRRSGAASSGAVPAVEAFLEHGLMRLARRPAEHYNENAPLGEAIGAIAVCARM